MEVKKITVRLRSKDGTDRLNVPINCTIAQLKEKVSEKIGLPTDAFSICQDVKHAKKFPNGSTIESLGFSNGEMVFVDYAAERPEDTKPKSEVKVEYKPGGLMQGGGKIGEVKRKWTVTQYMDLLEERGLVFRQQPEVHCSRLELDMNAADHFQAYLQATKFSQIRIALLFGKYKEDGAACVSVCYEPPQDNTPTSFKITLEGQKEKAEKITELLGLDWVGWAIAHPPDRSGKFILSSYEFMMAAKFQAEALKRNPDRGAAFATLTLTQLEDGTSSFEAYQVSDQAVTLHNNDLFLAPTSDTHIKAKEEILMHAAGVGRKDSNEVETTIMLVNVPIVEGEEKPLLHTQFPIENRGEHSQTAADLNEYLTRNKGMTFTKLMSDFHLLLYLGSNFFAMDTDIPTICKAVRNGTTIESEGYKLILNAVAGL